MRLLFKLGTSQRLTLAEASQFFEFEERRDRFHEQRQAAITEVNAETTTLTAPVVKDTNTTTLATPKGVPDKKSKEPKPTNHN